MPATFRLDFLRIDGTVSSPVGERWDASGDPFTCRHMQTARAAATGAAQRAEADVAIIRQGTEDRPDRVVLIAKWDGSFARPPAARAGRERDDCKGDDATPPCFCPAHRAARREARRSSST